MPDVPGFEEAFQQAVSTQADAMIDGIAGVMGTPPGAKRYTRQEMLDEWNFSPIADPQERMNKALEMHVQGATGETITDFLYPNVRRLIETGRTKPDEQDAFAREMRKLAGWPDVAPQTDEEVAATIPPVPQPPVPPAMSPMDPMAAQMPMQPAPAPMPVAPPPVPAPMANPMQPMPAPPIFNPLSGLGG